jgi:hypothetical protein
MGNSVKKNSVYAFSMKNYIPSEHMIMVWIAAALLVLSGIAYFFSPQDKSEAFMAIMTVAMGFITGKFSNGFRSKGGDK